MKKIAVIGAGYVGMATALSLARKDHAHVTIVEVNDKKLSMLSSGISPINEDGMTKSLKHRLGTSISITNRLSAISDTECVFICVGTPSTWNDALSREYVKEVMYDLYRLNYKGYVVIKSTLNLGDSEKFAKYHPYLKIIFSPEFLREGSALKDALNPSRLVFGFTENIAYDEHLTVKDYFSDLYKYIVGLGSEKVLYVSASSAEMAKLGANSYLATKLTYFNELSNLCTKCGANIKDVRDIICMDPRIGDTYASPSLGYAGPCLPKDTLALLRSSKKMGSKMKILEGTIDSNKSMISNYADWIKKMIKEKDIKSVLFLGVAFKSYSDDLRDSLSIQLYDKVKKYANIVHAIDPRANVNTLEDNQNPVFDMIIISSSEYQDLIHQYSDDLTVLIDVKECTDRKYNALYYGI